MSAKIQLISTTTAKVITGTYELVVDGLKIVYIEYVNDKGKVIDTILRTAEGIELTDEHLLDTDFNSVAALLEEVQAFIDKH